jgi:hypothetical protein
VFLFSLRAAFLTAHRPLAVAGTISSTLLTLLVVATFYDRIERACARMGALGEAG